MAAKPDAVIRWNRCRGRNGHDPADLLPDDMAAECTNVVFDQAGLGRARYGSTAYTTAVLADLVAGAFFLYGFRPGQAASGQLLLVQRGDGEFVSIAGSGVDTVLTTANINDGNKWEVSGATINGKAYLAYNSDENRLHVLDPQISSTIIRRSGLETPAAATVADTGAGTYAATIRRYRIQWRTLVGGLKQRASLLGASVAFTPSGAGTAARVTRPSAPGEGETHWVVFGTAASVDDGAAWFEVSGEIAIATTTYDDSVVPSVYDDGEPAPDEGAFSAWPSVKYLATDGQRLLGFGVWETAAGDAMEPLTGRVYISPVLDSSDYDDDERVSNTTTFKGWVDIGRNVGVADRGIRGPINGEFLVGQSRGVTLLSPTGDATDPFTQRKISPSIGWVNHHSAFVGEDEEGDPCIYFLDPMSGPYRYGKNGLEWCGYDVQDLWRTFNADATHPAWGMWDEPSKCAIFVFARTVSNTPNTPIWFFPRQAQRTATQGVRYGWTRVDTTLINFYHSTGFSANVMSAATDETMAIWSATGLTGGGAVILMRMGIVDQAGFSASSVTTDNGTSFGATVQSKVWSPLAPFRAELISAHVDALITSGSSQVINWSYNKNFGEENFGATVTVAASSARKLFKIEGRGETLSDIDFFQVQLAISADAPRHLHGYVAFFKRQQLK